MPRHFELSLYKCLVDDHFRIYLCELRPLPHLYLHHHRLEVALHLVYSNGECIQLVRDPFSRRGWIFEIKWDGFRTIAEIDGSGAKLYSRNQNSFTKKFAEIAKTLAGLGHRAVLDGEVVALDEEGHSRFEWLFRRNGSQGKGRLVYYVFDLLYLNGEDLRGLPLHRRKARLKKILRKLPNVIYVDHIEEHGTEFFNLARERGLEGIVAKDKQSPYVSGRETNYWLKIKNRDFQRKEPVEFKPPRRK